MLQTLLFCDNTLMVQVIYYLKVFLNLIRFCIPLLLIVVISIDLYKAMMIGEDRKAVIQKSGKRILASIIVFITPTIINLLMTIIGNFSINIENEAEAFASCYNEASLDLIKKLQNQENLKLKNEEEEKRKANITAASKYQAQNKAAVEEAQKKQLDVASGVSSNGSYSSNLTDTKKQNGVFIQNGTFYIPNTESGRGCPNNAMSQGYNNPYGYNNYFYKMLTSLVQGAKNAGYNLSFDKQGCRSYSYQQDLARKYSSTPGRAARPGNSRHGWGIASDLTFYKNATEQCGSVRTKDNCPGMAWVHNNAYKYGLKFPLLNANYREDWHIEPINLQKY